LVSPAGVVVWQAAYLPYGKAQVITETVHNNLRFPGQYFDEETGLHYNWNRYYDPATGRYISADPIGLEGGLNLYAYVGGNPVNWSDPEGLACVIKSYIEARLTGQTDTIEKLDSHPLDPLMDSISMLQIMGYYLYSISFYTEYKYEREQWANFNVLVEVCTDDCGNFIRRTPLGDKIIQGTEYWVTIHEWQRTRTVMMGVPKPISSYPDESEKWKKIY